MAYVPPHRRVQSSSMPETPPHGRVQSSSMPETPPRSVKRLYCYPEADVDGWSTLRMWFAVDANANPPANLQLEFKPFPGSSYPHLRGRMFYTISVNPHPVDDVENGMRSLMINETHPWRYTCDKIKGDLRECFQRLESYVKVSEPYYAKPTFTARLGKNLFHGGGLPWHESVNSDTLEKILKGEISLQNLLKKTFETHISKDIFEVVKEKAITSLGSPTLKEKVVYLIMVEDELNPTSCIRLKCHKKGTYGKQLELTKVELGNLLHFMADASCLKMLMDWRLSVTERYLIDPNEEDKESFEEIVKSACIEANAKGGLHWPYGGLVRDRFKVTGVWNLNVTTIVGKTWDMKFQQANRVYFSDYSCRVSNEIDLKLKSITKHLRDQRPWEEENIMNILEDNLKWVWMEGLQEHKLVHKD